METVTDPMEGVTTYTYNGVNQLTEETNAIGATHAYAYNSEGLLETYTDAEEVVTGYTYDAAGQLIRKQVVKGENVISYIHYTYDEAGNVVRKESSQQDGSVASISSVTMTYDKANRIKTYNGETVTYDKEGNMTYGPSTEGILTEYTYNCRNQLIQADNVTYEYDAEGNRTAQIEVNAEKVADIVKLGSRIVGDGGALLLSGGQAVESAKQVYTNITNGEGLTWKNAVDVITLGISVAGMGMAGVSIANSFLRN